MVGVGASAGGLDAITRLLKPIPRDPAMAFLVVQHLDPNRASLLTEILARTTSLKVTEAEDGMTVEPGHVYVIPPAANMALSAGALSLRPRVDSNGIPMPIDYLFRSMAHERGRRSIGVILSGGGTDGSLGVEAIKGEGGITFAQDERTAQHDSMPRSAIASGCVDFVLDPEGIARELLRIASHRLPQRPTRSRPSASSSQVGQPRGHLRPVGSPAGLDFSHYKRATTVRRIERRMALLRLDDLGSITAGSGTIPRSLPRFIRTC